MSSIYHLPVRSRYSLIFVAAISSLFTGCGGSSGRPDITPRLTYELMPSSPPVSSIPGPLGDSLQVTASQYIRNGIYYASIPATDNSPIAAPGAAEFAANSEGGFSTTNTQEEGVDEADRVEYDGDYMYLATYPSWHEENRKMPSVRILQRQADATLEEVNQLALQDEEANVLGMYLADQRLATINTSMHGIPIDFAVTTSFYSENTFSVELFDVGTPSQASRMTHLSFDGFFVNSRRIGQQLYIVSTFYASVDGVDSIAQSNAARRANFDLINTAPNSEIAPEYRVDGGNDQPMVNLDDCHIPQAAQLTDGHPQMLIVTQIDMDIGQPVNSLCIASSVQNIYASSDNLYLMDAMGDDTQLHKVSLSGVPDYQASGQVDGFIGWSSHAALRLSEQDDLLRVVTTRREQGELTHALFVLEQVGSGLNVVARLPNEQQPEPIGKPGEDIFAVRYIDDRAYIVTFERIDPLYVIDLSDQRNPRIAGSLEIPGFSSYLFPIGDDYLLGVGQQVEQQDIPATGTAPLLPPPVSTGMKVSLFDITDPASPQELDNVVKENAYTPVEFDYRVLAALSSGTGYRFAMPVESWSGSDELGIWMPLNSLLMLDVDTSSVPARLFVVDELTVESENEWYIYAGNDRAVIHNDDVYYVHGDQVWLGQWLAGGEPVGPF